MDVDTFCLRVSGTLIYEPLFKHASVMWTLVRFKRIE